MKKTVIGVIGGGQLCRMMGEDIRAKKLPFELLALDPTPESPAYEFLSEQLVGDFKDPKKIRELASKSDVLTYEIELANGRVLEDLVEEGKPVHPAPETLQIIQDKYTQASFLRKNEIAVPDFIPVEYRTDFFKGMEMFGLPLMIKARTDSYDGRGNFVLRDKKQIDDLLQKFKGRQLMIQRYVPFDTEVSVIAARSTTGEVATYPVVENIHGRDYNILMTTIAPARVLPELAEKAKKLAEMTMESLKGAGVFGIEMLIQGDEILINEIAPRVHNSGHYTIEASETSQFEQHLRAITGMSLGDTKLSSPAVMHNIIGVEGFQGKYQITYNGQVINGTCEVEPGVYVHNYGKHEVKPWRKMGHVTIVGYHKTEELLDKSLNIQKLIYINPRK